MAEQATETKREKVPMNGVDTPTLLATINAVKEQPELARFQFRASSQWLEGTHSRSKVESFTGAGGHLLHGLAGCLTAGIANIAAARGVKLTSVESSVEGNIDLGGVLGISDARNGYEDIQVTFKVKGDAPAEKLQQIVEQSKNRSAVYDVITKGTPIKINVEAA